MLNPFATALIIRKYIYIWINESCLTLLGVYIGAHGLYSSEVIQIKRKFGQWQEGGDAKEHQNLEFYEYIEAVKLTGDPNVPAGQVNVLHFVVVPVLHVTSICIYFIPEKKYRLDFGFYWWW